MSEPASAKLSAADVVEGFQLAHAVWALHDLDVLASLERPATARAVAAKHRLNADLLRGVLEYVAARTDLVEKRGSRFVAGGSYSPHARFLLDLYAGAYGPNAVQLGRLLAKPALAPAAVDRRRHARAFQHSAAPASPWVAAFVEQMQWNHVLDVGCGPAALLARLARENPQFAGWGLDANPAMCKAARARIRAASASARVKIFEGDARRLRSVVPAAVRDAVQVVVARQVANEMFGDGAAGAVAWLAGIRTVLPGRVMLIEDYYGRLGTHVEEHRPTLLHDYVQLISGQGVPPPGLAAWRKIYAAAGCRLVHVSEDTSTTRFIHVIVLSEPPARRGAKPRAGRARRTQR
jgi:SAM-dependent methyltransferase